MQQKWQNACFKPTPWEDLYTFICSLEELGWLPLNFGITIKIIPVSMLEGCGKKPREWDMWRKVTVPSQQSDWSPGAEPPRSIHNWPQTSEREQPRREEPFSWAQFKPLICRITSFKNGCCLKQISFGEVCYTAIANWNYDCYVELTSYSNKILKHVALV